MTNAAKQLMASLMYSVLEVSIIFVNSMNANVLIT